MAFVTINGIELECLVNTGDRDDQEIGEGLSRAFDGSAQRSRRAIKRTWSFQTLPDAPTTSQAFKALLLGEGHHWTFDADLYSDGGLGPSASTLATIVAGGQFNDALQLGATTGSITYAGLGGGSGIAGFTLLIQRKESGVWHDYHLSWNASGTLTAVYEDGAVQATTLPSWITSYTHSTGTLILNNTTGVAQLYDEMVALPFEAPLSLWALQIWVWRSTNAWAALPKLTLGGTMLSAAGTAIATVEGKPGKSKLQVAVIDGATYDGAANPPAESFPFDLWEA